MTYRTQRTLGLGQGRSVLAVPALGLAALLDVSCGSQFEASGSGGAGGSSGASALGGTSAGGSGHSGAPSGGAGSDTGDTEGGAADEVGAPSGGRRGTAGSTAGGAAGAAAEGGSGGSVVVGTGGTAAGGGSGGAPACLDAQTSDANCGACGYACVNGRHCSAGRCAPAWQPISEDGAPSPRTRHAAAALGGKYVVLGGAPSGVGVGMSSTAAYDPATNSWSTLPPLNSARCSHEAVSTGTAVLTFGGLSDCGNGTTTTPGLESFTPDASGGGSWSTMSIAGEPEHRYAFASTWTGSALFVYGGGTNTQPAVSSGALFSLSSSTWFDASCALAGCERSASYVFRDGNSVRVWGGGPFGNAPAGLSYDLVGQSWSAWTVPTGTADHLAQRFADDGRRIYFLTAANVVSVYDRKTSSWLANDDAVMPVGFCTEAAAAWTGSELVAWSGSCGGGAPLSVGGRYQPAVPN